jgi:hypothetical protein
MSFAATAGPKQAARRAVPHDTHQNSREMATLPQSSPRMKNSEYCGGERGLVD